MEGAERISSYTRLFIFFPDAEAHLESERKSDQSQKGRNPCSLEACVVYLTLNHSNLGHKKSIESPEGKEDKWPRP